jgi:hypothetical protein
MFRHRTKGATWRNGNIAFAEHIERELSTPAPCAIGATYINQNVKRSMWSVRVTTKIIEEAYCEITPVLIDLAHFNDAILRTCQSCGSATLDDRTIIRGTMSLFFPASIPLEVPLAACRREAGASCQEHTWSQESRHILAVTNGGPGRLS